MEDGFLDTTATALADQLAFDQWCISACAHEDSTLIHHRLGNIAHVGQLRAALSEAQERFPILLERVVYNGVHAGDFIPYAMLGALSTEVEALASILPLLSTGARASVDEFRRQMRELIAAAMTVQKPIAF